MISSRPSIGMISLIISFLMLFALGLLLVPVVGIPRLIPGLPAGVYEIQMGVFVVLAVGVLLVLLHLMADGFSFLGLANPGKALGLPEGSVRAMIALFLIIIFIIVGIYLFRTVSGLQGVELQDLKLEQVNELGSDVIGIKQNEGDSYDVVLRTTVTDAGEQLALQFATILGTLVTAVTAFYFGSNAVASGQRTSSTPTDLRVDSITPDSGDSTNGQVVTLTGYGIDLGARVKLTREGAVDIPATKQTVINGSIITCTFDLTPASAGLWDLVVINPDGNQVKKEKMFRIM